ncbi:MAG: hypothetical protein SFU53_02545 [Terrimicrobiaceae bacterium]|nr:hypothetical protein [Terrimicrobiaceae bacterium]
MKIAWLLLAAAAPVQSGIEIHSDQVVHECSPHLGGTNIKAHDLRFASGGDGIDHVKWARQARIPLIRTLAYPDKPGHDPTPGGRDLAEFDRNVSAILAAGARPLFIQYIEPGLRYVKANGDPGGSVAENMVFLVQHYAAAPFHLELQHWEIGNEPDYDIDYRVESPEAYTAVFNEIHDALVAAGLRERVRLCGPAVVSPYRHVGRDWDNTRFIDAVLRDCRHSVDVVTYHSYSPHGDEWNDPIRLLNDPVLEKLENAQRGVAAPDDFGAAALAEAVHAAQLQRTGAGIGITEYNTNTLHHSAASGLYNLMVQQFHARNPLSRLTCSFVFDEVGMSYGGNGHFAAPNEPNANYWALWIAGNLRGDEVVRVNAPADGRLLVLATRDRDHVFLEVINRTASGVEESVSVDKGGALQAVHRLDANTTPDQAIEPTDGGKFAFPPLSATVLVFRRGGD